MAEPAAAPETTAPPKTPSTHPAAAGDASYEVTFYIDEEAENKRKEVKAAAKAKQEAETKVAEEKAAAAEAAEDEPVEMVEIKDRVTGDVIFAGPASAEWKKGDDGKPITYADRFGHENGDGTVTRAAPEAEASAPAEAEAVDLELHTVVEIKQALDDAGVSYPSNATKAALIKLCQDNDVTVA